MLYVLTITRAQLDELVCLSESEHPYESVALLLGSHNNISQIVPMRNIDRSKISFSIDPSELIEAYTRAEQNSLDVVGIFHSHPGPPEPSKTDLKYMEINPVIWLIYSNTVKEFKAHIFDNGLKTAEIIGIK